MITLNGFNFELDGGCVGVFTGTPSDRMAVEDALNGVIEKPDDDTHKIVSKSALTDQIARIDDAVEELDATADAVTINQLKSIADELRDLIK